MSAPGVPSTTVHAVAAEAMLLDVREDAEWAAGHATGALHIPLAQLPGRLAELTERGEGTVYVLCRSGGRSAQATAWLNQNGVDAINVDGGTLAWAQANKPMTATDAVPPSVL